jgi:peptide/nickel transport system permease protein
MKNKSILAGGFIIILLTFTTVFAFFIALHDPAKQNLEKRLLSPNNEYPLGTDHFGRCIFSRLVYGTRTSLTIAIAVSAIVVSIGTIVGMIAGYYSMIDNIVMRITDIALAFPSIVLALAIVGMLGPSIPNIIIALSATGWGKYARLVRGTVLSIKEKEFIESARALGCSDAYILFRHILPNCMAPIVVVASLGIGGKIISIASLGFLGLGVQPPAPEWGTMIKGGLPLLHVAPHIVIFSGLMIMITVLGFNLLGDGLRDALDPRLKNMMMK